MVQPSNDAPVVLPLDEIFDVLVSSRRRAVLYELHGRSEPMTLPDLVAAVRAIEAAQSRKQVAVALDHVHLPKLQQAGLVEYDRYEKTVQLNRIPRQFERYLRFAAEDEQQTGTIDATV